MVGSWILLPFLFQFPRAAPTLPMKNIFCAEANLVSATFPGKYSALLFFHASHTLDNHQDRPYKRHIHSKTVGYSTLIILCRRIILEKHAFLAKLTGVWFGWVAFSEENDGFKCLQFFVSAFDVYPSNTEKRLEAQNSPETGGVQRLKLENTSIWENSLSAL